MHKQLEKSVIEERLCPYCGMKFLVRLRMSDITDIKGWIMATKAKENFKAEYQTHVAKCLDKL
jgi:DNA-directed RNA polymerase subunit RPC12/RpoP